MAQTGYTPIQIYYSTTTTNAPSAGNLLSGELAINITDGKMFYKDNGGVVQVIAWKTTPTTAGGTGLTSWTAGDLPYYSTGTTLTKLGIGTNGQVLTSTGTAPQWSTLSGVAVTTFSAGTTGFTPSVATSGAVTLGGTLATTNGGTGLTSFTANRVFYASSTSAIAQSANLQFSGTDLTVYGVSVGRGASGVATNTITGNGALQANTTGGNNAAFGYSALFLNSSGLSNTAVGSNALYANTTASNSTAVGFQAGAVSTGASNNFFGTGAGSLITTGAKNTVLGAYNGNQGGLDIRTASNYLVLSDGDGNPRAYWNGADPTLPGSITLSGGTANGVAYLNASKVLTTGSALTFDGSVLRVNNAGDSDFKLTTTNTGSGATDGLLLRINSTGTEGYLWNWEPSSSLIFGANGTEQMRLTSTGLGVGTASPAYRLQVTNTVASAFASVVSVNTGTAGLLLGDTDSATIGRVEYDNAGNFMALYTNGSERFRIDSAGNAGLGATPNTWTNTLRATQMAPQKGGFYGGYIGAALTTGIAGNAYHDTTWKYVANAVAARYEIEDAAHKWYTTGTTTGAAGSTISFTQAMTLDASGNLGIGTTVLGNKLEVNGGINMSAATATIPSYGMMVASGVGTQITSALNTTFYNNGSERARITSAGNVGIGTSSPGTKLVVTGAGNITTTISSSSGFAQLSLSGSSGQSSFISYTTTGGGGLGFFDATANAERLRIDSAGNAGLGVTPSAWGGSGVRALDIGTAAALAGSGSDVGLIANAYFNGTNWIYKTSSLSARYQILVGTGSHAWFTAPSGTAGNAISFTQAMTLNSAGTLLIGTTSTPGASTVKAVIQGPAGSDGYYQFTNANGGGGLIGSANGAGVNFYTFTGAVGSEVYTQRAVIDSSGNLGLGVTPSAWGANYKALQIPSGALAAFSTSVVSLYQNSYDIGVGAFRYSISAAASKYDLNQGAHYWYIAPSGTAGNAISFTQAMTLDASGNLIVGGTSPVISGAGRGNITINGSSTAVMALSVGGSAKGWVYHDNTNMEINAGTSGAMIMYTASTERARITSGGDFLIGKTSSTYNSSGRGVAELNGSTSSLFALQYNSANGYFLQVDSGAAYLWNSGNTPLIFGTNNTERARITSGGAFLVQSTSALLDVGIGHKIVPDAAQPYMGTVGSSTSNINVSYTLYSTGAASYRFYVGYGGTVYATNTTISAISDQRFKENIQDLDVGLDKIMALKPRKFDWKAGKGKDIKGDRGFIAQEFEQVFPDLIDEWKDPAPEGEEPYKSVRQDLIPVLVKAIQELKSELDTVKAELATLKGN